MAKLKLAQSLEERLKVVRANYQSFRDQINNSSSLTDEMRNHHLESVELQEKIEVTIETWLESVNGKDCDMLAGTVLGSSGKLMEVASRLGSDSPDERFLRITHFLTGFINAMLEKGFFNVCECDDDTDCAVTMLSADPVEPTKH